MIYIVGLGNPGKRYEYTRHNVGFIAVEKVAASFQQRSGAGGTVSGQPVAFQPSAKFFSDIAKIDQKLFIKPQTFMNDSGRAARALLTFHDKNLLSRGSTKGATQGAQPGVQPTATLTNLYVIHDDLDIPVGSYKIQFAKGPKVHNGLNSIYRELGTDQFWHIRIGVDGRNGDRTIPPQEYVLSGFSAEERELLDQVYAQIIAELQHTFAPPRKPV